jgi:transposase
MAEVAEVSQQSRIAPAEMGELEPQGKGVVARRIEDRARRVEALSLRLAGFSLEQIADRMELSISGVRDLVNRTLERAENTGVEEMRDIENARLDRAQAAIWDKVLRGEEKAVDTFLRISQRRARLNGLDMPTKVDLTMSIKQEMEQALARLENVVLGEVIPDGARD